MRSKVKKGTFFRKTKVDDEYCILMLEMFVSQGSKKKQQKTNK